MGQVIVVDSIRSELGDKYPEILLDLDTVNCKQLFANDEVYLHNNEEFTQEHIVTLYDELKDRILLCDSLYDGEYCRIAHIDDVYMFIPLNPGTLKRRGIEPKPHLLNLENLDVFLYYATFVRLPPLFQVNGYNIPANTETLYISAVLRVKNYAVGDSTSDYHAVLTHSTVLDAVDFHDDGPVEVTSYMTSFGQQVGIPSYADRFTLIPHKAIIPFLK